MVKIHEHLPTDLTGYELEQFLKRNAVETFEDEIKRYFSGEQLAEFEHESSKSGREFNRLNDLLAKISTYVKKGNNEDGAEVLSFDVPVTIGTGMLDKIRRQNDDFVEKGYEIEERTVYGIVNENDEVIEYFTSEGEIIDARTRSLTPKEKQKYLSLHVASMNAEHKQAANG